MAEFRPLSNPRRPTSDEDAYLQFLLSRPFEGSTKLREQLSSVKVVAECPCGCYSISLDVFRTPTNAATVRRRVPIEAIGSDTDGAPVHILLYVVDGYLAELALYREDGMPISRMPSARTLELFSLDDFA